MYNNPILEFRSSQNGQNNRQPIQNQQIQQLKDIMKQIQQSPNPQAALQNLLMSNPNYKNIMSLIQLNGGNLQQVAQYMANQRNVDLNALIQELQN